MRRLALLLACACPSTADAADAPKVETGPLRVYVGTYTGPKSRGIYLLELDRTSGELSPKGLGLVAEAVNPTFLAMHPNGRFLYAISEVGDFEGAKAGGVLAFAIDRDDGGLSPLNRRSSVGQGPCFIAIDPSGKDALVANYVGGNVAALPIGEDGKLAPSSSSTDQQVGGVAHAHSITLDPTGRRAVEANLGLDRLYVYSWDAAKGVLDRNDPPSLALPKGSGPRHFAFHPDGRHAFVNLETASRAVPLEYDADRGTFKAGPMLSTLPKGFDGMNNTADLHVHPTGKFLYVSNRGHDSLAIFAIDAQTGHLKPIGHQPTGGKTPRNFAIDPSGAFLLAANQDSGSVVVFRIDPDTGKLRPTGHSAEVPMPVCLTYAPRD